MPVPGLLISLISIFVSTASYAINNDYLQSLQQQANEKNLWQETEWLHLVHYQGTENNYKSSVIDDGFFNASDGKTSPKNELIATLGAFYQNGSEDNQNAQCRFVARLNWLTEKLAIDPDSLPRVNCTNYNEWRKTTQAGSATMIFPAYHLNSPSSMFGHTLLRLDPPDQHSDWLSLAVNFGANVDESDNSIVYAFRGLAGGYPGTFVLQPYFKKIQEYGRIEHRDIWEYKLNLTPEEIERMITHLWELKNIRFDYYFFDENCSYRLLELLEIARPGVELTDEFIVSAIPVDTVRAIEQENMISSVSYRPAQATEIQFKLKQIPEVHRNMVKRLAEDITITDSDTFNSLSEYQQKTIVDLAYKYLRYQNTRNPRDPLIAKHSHQLLQKLSTYPASIDINVKIPEPSPPEQGHKSKRTSISLGERIDNRYAALGFKMSFHDLEDNIKGFLQGAQINIGSMQLRAVENSGLRLHQLDLIDIFSLTPRSEFFHPLSWKIVTGFERQLTKNRDQLAYHVTGGAGGTWEIAKNHQLHALATVRLENNDQLEKVVEPAIGFNTGLLSHFAASTVHLEISGEQFRESIYRIRARYTQNFVISTNHAVKLCAQHEWQEDNIEFSDINLGYQYYF